MLSLLNPKPKLLLMSHFEAWKIYFGTEDFWGVSNESMWVHLRKQSITFECIIDKMVVLIERLWALLENLFSLKNVLWFIINWGIIWYFLPCTTKASIAWKCFSYQTYLISSSCLLTCMWVHIHIAVSWSVLIQINIHPPISYTSLSLSAVEGNGANPSCFWKRGSIAGL